MFDNLIIKKDLNPVPMPSADEINKSVGIPKVVQRVDDKGRLVSELVFEVTPVEKLNDGLKVDDFALEVLLQNGYDLHRVDYNNVGFDDIAKVDQVAKTMSTEKEVVDSVKSKVKLED